MFDNGQSSVFHMPRGEQRHYASPRKYKLDLNAKSATKVSNFESGAKYPWCPYMRVVSMRTRPSTTSSTYTFVNGPIKPKARVHDARVTCR